MENKNEPMTLSEINEAAEKRVLLISEEFIEGFEFIKNYPKSVTFFGSARTKENEKCYERARKLAEKIVKELRYSIITGGGPGIMEAANRGAFESGGNSVGLTIELPKEQEDNRYLTDRQDFHYFFSRKVCLSFSAEAYIFFPGGFGTLDEFLEILTLIQTKKIPKAPMILVGKSFWTPLENFFKEVVLKNKMINEEDINIYKIAEEDDEILKIIKEAPVRIGLKYNGDKDDFPAKESKDKGHEPLSGLFKKIGW